MKPESGNGRVPSFQNSELSGGEFVRDVPQSISVSEHFGSTPHSENGQGGGVDVSKGDVLRGVIVAFSGVAIATKLPELGISIEAMGAAYAYVARLRLRAASAA
ncbi:MAG: hypothetical protein RLZZ455_65 [Candidatus Parcubacteria bacterium]|jgi:hypothetical protein